MSLKNKKKIYLSLNEEVLQFVETESCRKNMTRSKFINEVLLREYEKHKNIKIDSIIEGKSYI